MAEKQTNWSVLITEIIKQGKSQAQIAHECGVAQTHISKLYRGETKNPSYSLGVRLIALSGAGDQGVQHLSVLDVLELCERDFAFIGGCTMTDRPDLPLSPETSWVMDVSQRLADIRAAKRALVGQAGLGARVPEQKGFGRHG